MKSVYDWRGILISDEMITLKVGAYSKYQKHLYTCSYMHVHF